MNPTLKRLLAGLFAAGGVFATMAAGLQAPWDQVVACLIAAVFAYLNWGGPSKTDKDAPQPRNVYSFTLLALILCLAMGTVTTASAQAPPPANKVDLTGTYDFTSKQFTPFVSYELVSTQTNVFSTKFNIDVLMLGGTAPSGALSGGLAFTTTIKLSNETGLILGPYFRAEVGERPRGGVFLGLVFKP